MKNPIISDPTSWLLFRKEPSIIAQCFRQRIFYLGETVYTLFFLYKNLFHKKSWG